MQKIVQQFQLSYTAISDVQDSHSSTVYKITLLHGEEVYLKIPYTKVKFERELEAYQLLQNRVATPKLIDYWQGDETCPGAFLLSSLKGAPLSVNTATPRTAYEVGKLHASLHEVIFTEQMEVHAIQNEFENWPDFIGRQFYSFAEDVQKVLTKQTVEQAIAQFERMKQGLPMPEGPSFVHMDFRPANIIVDGESVSGVIDFESVRFGATEVDFTKLKRDFLRFDAKLDAAYQEGYNSLRPLIDLNNVLPFYRFADAFNSIGWCVRRGIEKNQRFYEENHRLLHQLLR
ncbi:phosphotransferase [Solibacillus sp. R5-41]|uniref:aminoglycoside phosphotransferase family protein n=1 Tax=Solibacillus sp. R5-41 TaxID=2048654 RepID=UPI000C125127|nr:aminoglycoside phosphotransferase family protein [Solibacillus sp. R5-41]ATP41990.1 phosphotransferase [Solibacillus sp. R5-41]